jgi:hypothetical protein
MSSLDTDWLDVDIGMDIPEVMEDNEITNLEEEDLDGVSAGVNFVESDEEDDYYDYFYLMGNW